MATKLAQPELKGLRGPDADNFARFLGDGLKRPNEPAVPDFDTAVIGALFEAGLSIEQISMVGKLHQVNVCFLVVLAREGNATAKEILAEYAQKGEDGHAREIAKTALESTAGK